MHVHAFSGVFDSSGCRSIYGMTASSRKTPLRVVRHSSEMVEKLSPWPERATKADRILVGGRDSGSLTVSEVPPTLVPVKGKVESVFPTICCSTNVLT